MGCGSSKQKKPQSKIEPERKNVDDANGTPDTADGKGGNDSMNRNSLYNPGGNSMWFMEADQEGSVKIKTISFELTYDDDSYSIKEVKDCTSYSVSELSWQKNSSTGDFDFVLKDVYIIDILTGRKSDTSAMEFKFTIDQQGEFNGLNHPEPIIQGVLENQEVDSAQISEEDKKDLLRKIEADFKKVWESYVQNWVELLGIKPKKKHHLIGGREPDCQIRCFQVEKSREETSDKLEKFLRRKLHETVKRLDEEEAMANGTGSTREKQVKKTSSKAMLRARKADGMEGETSVDDDTNGENLDVKFYFAEKSDDFHGIVEQSNLRPHQIRTYFNKKIAFKFEDVITADIIKEMKLSIFSWEDLPEINKESYYMTEMRDFQNECKAVKKSLEHELKALDLPLH
eukprot:CAMPEP_0114991948 /NCGR_PEP_ID=MMETSP0216-20121206/11665_1 /TAXON_ID=223996 /ORGANISM="Protocruzia adherens, Strain Boccale" /LENGTH=399 /DNA_ID=CAMNT_0002355351 /DNA_START=304 /DNA_END=1503 /DNA_ORIENTATION=+